MKQRTLIGFRRDKHCGGSHFTQKLIPRDIQNTFEDLSNLIWRKNVQPRNVMKLLKVNKWNYLFFIYIYIYIYIYVYIYMCIYICVYMYIYI